MLPVNTKARASYGSVKLKSLCISNFKSFKQSSIDFSNLTVIIGANSSGKSNLISALKFIQDVIDFGLKEAISIQGGKEFVQNFSIGDSKNTEFKLTFSIKEAYSFTKEVNGQCFMIEPKEAYYFFSLKPMKNKKEEFLVREEISALVNMKKVENTSDPEYYEIKENLGQFTINISKLADGSLDFFSDPQPLPVSMDDIIPFLTYKTGAYREKPVKDDLFLRDTMIFSPAFSLISSFIGTIKFYNIDPKLSKKPCQITGSKSLNADGSNLAVVLKDILSNPSRKKRFLTIVQDTLPFIDGASVHKLDDNSLFFYQRETYTGKLLPAFLCSDGTIDVFTFIVALFFSYEDLMIAEEPERNIHPYLISKIVEMMIDVSSRFDKQIIVTTHNPLFVKNAGIRNLLFIQRDSEGFSEAFKPEEKEQVKEFLKDKIGIEDLFIENLIGD
jgi:predicted ATPase